MNDELFIKDSVKCLLKTACEAIVVPGHDPITRSWLSFQQHGGITGWIEEDRVSYRPVGIRLLPYLRRTSVFRQMLEAFIENDSFRSKIAVNKDEVINNTAAWGEVSIWVWRRII